MSKLILILLIIVGIYFFFIKSRKKKTEENENEFIQCDKCSTFVLKKNTKLINNKRLCKECYENS